MIRLLPLLLLACSGGDPGERPQEIPAAPPIGTAAETPAPAAPDTSNLPRVPATSTERFAASHVLVSYAGAFGALPTVTRSKDEGRARAEEARKKILAGEPFAEVAKAYSDDPNGPRGGSLGGFDRGTMVEPFQNAVEALAVGGVSELVETPFGYHIVLREPLAEIRVQHLVVTWAGADRAPTNVTRDKAAAKARMDEALAKLAAGESWGDIVRKYTDGPLKDDAGDLGWLTKGQLAESLDAVAFDLDIGATSAVVETPRGFHVVRRAE